MRPELDKELVRETKCEVGLVGPAKPFVESEFQIIRDQNFSVFQPVLCLSLGDRGHRWGVEAEIVSLARAQGFPGRTWQNTFLGGTWVF